MRQILLSYVVGCRGVVQLGDLFSAYLWEIQLKLRLVIKLEHTLSLLIGNIITKGEVKTEV